MFRFAALKQDFANKRDILREPRDHDIEMERD